MNPHEDRAAAVDPRAPLAGPPPAPGATPPWDGSTRWPAVLGGELDDPGPAEPAPLTPRSLTLAISTVSLAVLLAVASIVPLPYAISSPGPTRNTLGEENGTPLIAIEGEPTYEPTGELRLTTVAVAGGPGYPVGLLRVLDGWALRPDVVEPVETVFEPRETQDDITERNQAAMISSQENATVAALEELGYAVPTVLEVAETMTGYGSAGILEPGDVVTSIDGQDVLSFSELSARLDEVDAGRDVVVGVERDGEQLELDVTTSVGPDDRALLGILIDPEFDLPVDVRIQIENIGGPSAGTMFALGIIDLLTPEDEANGVTIAGTGTMDLAGSVGPIGGIRQKLTGALRDGAAWFLAPAANCGQVVGHVPEGLRVVRVSTLAEARAAVEAIGSGEGDALPTCE